MYVDAVIKDHCKCLTIYLMKTRGLNTNAAYAMLVRTKTYKMLCKKDLEIFDESTQFLEHKLEQELSGNWKQWEEEW